MRRLLPHFTLPKANDTIIVIKLPKYDPLPYAITILTALGLLILTVAGRVGANEDVTGPSLRWPFSYDSPLWDVMFTSIGIGVLAAFIGIFLWSKRKRQSAKIFGILSALSLLVWASTFTAAFV